MIDWKPITEIEPKILEDVLLWVPEGDGMAVVGHRSEYTDKTFYFLSLTEEMDDDGCHACVIRPRPTHWAPMPEGPR